MILRLVRNQRSQDLQGGGIENDTAPYSTSDKTSFAYVSARDRWPVILVIAALNPSGRNKISLRPKTGAIDDVHRAISACDNGDKVLEGKSIVEGLAKLKYELQHNRSLT